MMPFRVTLGDRPKPPLDSTVVGVPNEEWRSAHAEHLQAGPYRLDSQIDAGGESNVWFATHIGNNSPAAVKVQRSNVYSDRMHREVAVLYALHSVNTPNVVKLLPATESGVIDPEPGIMRAWNGEELRYCALERLPSKDGRNIMARTPLKPQDVLELCYALRATLRVMHLEFQMLHNDLKPDNVIAWREKRDRQLHVCLLDFGQAALLAPHAGAVLPCVTPEPAHRYVYVYGSRPYMAPERWHGKLYLERLRARSSFEPGEADAWPREAVVDERADQWALAATVFELLTGRRLVAGSTDDQHGYTIMHGTYLSTLRDARLPGRSAQVKDVLSRALALNPADRYQPAQAVSGLDLFCIQLEAALS